MGKKFMIVKPKPCCGDTSGIGSTYEFSSYFHGISQCISCGRDTSSRYGERLRISPSMAVHESRIVWLPDEDEFKNETYDEELTV